jgi:hypothetical protein
MAELETAENRKAETKTTAAASNRKRTAAQANSASSSESGSGGSKSARMEKDSSPTLPPELPPVRMCRRTHRAVVKMEDSSDADKSPSSATGTVSGGDGHTHQLSDAVTSGSGAEVSPNAAVAAAGSSSGSSFDPYEFVAKQEEDVVVSPMKKFKSEKVGVCDLLLLKNVKLSSFFLKHF